MAIYGVPRFSSNFLSDFNRYLVKISWPSDLIGDSWILSRRNNNQTTELARIEKEKTSFTDETVKGGELYTYFLNSIEKDGLKIIGEKTVTVPIDYLIDGDTFPAEIKNANRIFVPKKVILKSNGKNLSWNANEIFIDDTFTIDTTPPYKRLLPGADEILY
jgi:fibronectin type 3 domain-containing protein